MGRPPPSGARAPLSRPDVEGPRGAHGTSLAAAGAGSRRRGARNARAAASQGDRHNRPRSASAGPRGTRHAWPGQPARHRGSI
eukprot:scaffold7202_cov403-Prasinococcus_capsulatus_cf.AAC.2